ncbi:MAG: DUF1508 domain-containing protein [Solirubrobacteraceae bacterium]
MAQSQYYFTIRQDENGNYRARFWGNYGRELIWWTEGYYGRSGAENAIRIMRAQAATAPLL